EILHNFEQYYLNNPFGDRWLQVDRASYLFADAEYNRSNLSTPIYNQRAVGQSSSLGNALVKYVELLGSVISGCDKMFSNSCSVFISNLSCFYKNLLNALLFCQLVESDKVSFSVQR
ncbi:MAG: hypothetical protein ACKN9K_15490, partial [Dolichospermum sp.]